MRFLVENMPEVDLTTLSAAYLLENVALAYEAYDRAPWKPRVPKRIFLNEVLPYACLTEKRDGTRKFLRDTAAPLVMDCRAPAEAAHRLNLQLFSRLNTHYSPAGTRPDQCVLETIASGKATCIGLSVLLVGACRAVGIPARLVGTPLWTNLRGTHEWVEIWDGDWHFMGADEPYSEGLDHAWFNEDASKAIKDVPQHAIYATSFEKTGLFFPLVWEPNVRWINAVNVTDRYRTAWPPR
jgi:transglutaminase-like putative cysteine protease